QLPVALLRRRVLQLLRHAAERPVPVRGRQVDAAPVRVGIRLVQTVRPRADDAAVNDVVEDLVWICRATQRVAPTTALRVKGQSESSRLAGFSSSSAHFAGLSAM